MIKDISTFGCLPAGIAMIVGNVLISSMASEGAAGWLGLGGALCFAWLVYLGLPAVLGFFLARAKRNRTRSFIRNGLVAAILAAIVSPVVLTSMVFPIFPEFSMGWFQTWYTWGSLAFVVAGITAVLVTLRFQGGRAINKFRTRNANPDDTPAS